MSLSNFIGQEKVTKDLLWRINAARDRGTPLDHFLLCGLDEMGKATLASGVATKLQVELKMLDTSGAQKGNDVAALLTSMQANGILLIEQIEYLKEPLLSVIESAVANSQLDMIIGRNASARTIKLKLPRFTVIGTTSKPSQVNPKLTRWLSLRYDFLPYDVSQIAEIIALLTIHQGLAIDPDAASLMANYCNGLPGHAAVLTKRVANYCDEGSKPRRVTLNVAQEALASFGYLEETDNSQNLAAKLRDMNGIEFEEFTAKLFRDMGYTVELTQATGDHGIDLIIRKGNEFMAAQCKCWAKPVSEVVVREFFGSLVNSGARLGYIFATTTFTSKAQAFARDKPIKLVDLDALIQLVINQGARKS